VNIVLRTVFGRDREEEVIMRNKTNKYLIADMYIYFIISSVVCSMFQPPVVAKT